MDRLLSRVDGEEIDRKSSDVIDDEEAIIKGPIFARAGGGEGYHKKDEDQRR